MDLTGKRALVTGAGRGIGRGCAIELALAGADLVLNDRPGNQNLADVADEVRSLGRDCWTIAADAFSRTGCDKIVAEAIKAADRIDILISNPAANRRSSFLDYEPTDFEKVVQGTLIGGFHIGQLVARQMVRDNSGGKIVFISSVQAEMPLAGNSAYGAAKAGLNHMARTMSVELARHRINVNVIEPGWIDTPGEREAFDEEVIRSEGEKLPWGRLGEPEEVGKAAAFLASGDANYITGTVLSVDGGFRFKDCRDTGLIPAREQRLQSGER
jgi:glucose 1-dehydrogenase